LRLQMAGKTPPTSLCHVGQAQCIILLCIAIAAGVAQVDASVQPAGEAAQGDYNSALQAAITGDAATLRRHPGAVQSGTGRGGGGGQDGREPIHESARRGHVDAVQALVQRGADLNAVDQMGRTALMDAAWEGHPAVVKALLEAGADATIENAGGGTALKVAMRKKGDPEAQGEVIRLLREHLAQRPEDGRPREEKLKWHGDPDWKWNGGQGVEL
jgi:ankyrin repeat protein